MKKLLIIPILLLLFACNVQKRQIALMQVYAVRYPNDFKELANTLDPCFTGKAKSDTVTIKGKSDTVHLAGSTTITRIKDTVIKTITLPGERISIPYYTTIHDTVTNDRANSAISAQIQIATNSLTMAQTQLKDSQKAKSIWMWIAIGCTVLIIGGAVIKVYTLFTGGAAIKVAEKII